MESPPGWVVQKPETITAQPEAAKVAHLSKAFELLHVDSGTATHIRIMTDKVGDAYQPHNTAELEWLKLFSEIIAWMEQKFPDVLVQVRGDDW